MNFISGETLYINKPLKCSSFDVVYRLRKAICIHLDIRNLKVGHAGTLDPLASGVMIICTGKKTKQIEHYQAGIKEYIATIEFGATTPSFDMEHEIDATFPYEHITRALVDETIQKFVGEIWQTPPVYSAIKINGKRAFNYARDGQEVQLKAKQLIIDEIEVLEFNNPTLKLRIVCSKGTYIRALTRDIGEALKSGAHLTGLQRTRVGDVYLKDCLTIEQCLALIAMQDPAESLKDLPK